MEASVPLPGEALPTVLPQPMDTVPTPVQGCPPPVPQSPPPPRQTYVAQAGPSSSKAPGLPRQAHFAPQQPGSSSSSSSAPHFTAYPYPKPAHLPGTQRVYGFDRSKALVDQEKSFFTTYGNSLSMWKNKVVHTVGAHNKKLFFAIRKAYNMGTDEAVQAELNRIRSHTVMEESPPKPTHREHPREHPRQQVSPENLREYSRRRHRERTEEAQREARQHQRASRRPPPRVRSPVEMEMDDVMERVGQAMDEYYGRTPTPTGRPPGGGSRFRR